MKQLWFDIMNEVYIRKCSLPKSNLTNCLVYQVERLSSLVANSDIKPLRPLQGQQSTTYKSEYHSFHAVTKELGWLIMDRENTDIIKKNLEFFWKENSIFWYLQYLLDADDRLS